MGRTRIALRALLGAALLFVLYAVAMIVLHPRSIYPFGQEPFAHPGFERVVLDGGTVLYVSEGRPGAPILLYFMGNAGYLGPFAPMLDHHRAAGRHVVALAYPGGGGVTGAPSERLLKAQALAAFDALPQVIAAPAGPRIVQGYSLGTGLALHVAAQRPVSGTILTAPYARLCELMAQASWLPACQLPYVQRWDNLRLAEEVPAPVLVVHGSADTLIVPAQGRRLAEALPRAEFVEIAGAGHVDLMQFPAYLATLDGFIAARGGP